MIKEREEVCARCKLLPSIHHPDYPVCEQIMAPLNDEERRQLGDDRITYDKILRLAEISMQPYCMKRMMIGGFFDQFKSM